jgi:hypothetical protein
MGNFVLEVKVITAADAGMKYQSRLLYKEA